MSIAVTLLALLVEATFGYPDRVLRAIGHPVTWLGRMIDWLDATLNRDTSSGGWRKAAGFAAAFLTFFVPAVAAYAA
jgi:adenosylcobinamide-phosphate synthase